MPRPKKQPSDLTTDEAMKKLFPKKVRDEAKKEADEAVNPLVRESKRSTKGQSK